MGKSRNIAAAALLVLAGVAFGACGKKDAGAEGAQDGGAQSGGQDGTRGGRGGGGAGPARVVPVVVAKVERRDVPIYLEGLGNVTAFKTVAVRPQVDGRLDAVLFTEGKPVRRGEVLAQIDARPFQIQLKQAEGALARDAAQLQGATVNLARYKNLVARKLLAPQQADDQAAMVGQLAGAVRIDEAQVSTARLNLSYTRIVAPIDGVTGVRQIDPGNLVRATDATGIVVITQLDPISVIFTLPEDELPQIAQQLARGDLPVDAYSREGATKLGTGKLSLIDNQINTTTATVRLKAVFANPQHMLWPNQFIKARLLLTTRKDALVVPSTVVQRGPEGTFAYVVNDDQTVSPRPIAVELAQGDLTLIARGLTAGEQVVVDGQAQLRPGAKVLPHAAGAAPGAPQKPQQAAGNAVRVGPAR